MLDMNTHAYESVHCCVKVALRPCRREVSVGFLVEITNQEVVSTYKLK